LVYHLSDPSGVPPSSSRLYVVDKQHLHGLDEEELEEYAAEHPDCVNGIYDVRFPADSDPARITQKIRVRIYDVLKASQNAKVDNLVSELPEVDLAEVLRSKQPVVLMPRNPVKPEISERLKNDKAVISISARLRRNIKEKGQTDATKGGEGRGPAVPVKAPEPRSDAVSSTTSSIIPAVPVSAASHAGPSGFAPSVTSACNTAAAFRLLRRELREYGVARFQAEMVSAGWFERSPATGELQLTTDVKPFNPFTRLVSGKLPATYGNLLLKVGLESRDAHFFVAQNRPELDAQWDSSDPSVLGRASMSRRHQFLLLRSLAAETFNVATFGLAGGAEGLAAALRLLHQMDRTAREYTSRSGWSSSLGLFFHSFPFNSVQALHLHMVDLETTGPTFQHLQYKNLPMQDVIEVLMQEMREMDEKLAKQIQQEVSDIDSLLPCIRFSVFSDSFLHFCVVCCSCSPWAFPLVLRAHSRVHRWKSHPKKRMTLERHHSPQRQRHHIELTCSIISRQ
jgi:hypothetical protein